MHLTFTSTEWFVAGVAALWIFSAAVAALPVPDTGSGTFYKWAFRFLKIIAGDLSATFGKYLPPQADSTEKTQ